MTEGRLLRLARWLTDKMVKWTNRSYQIHKTTKCPSCGYGASSVSKLSPVEKGVRYL